MVLYSSLILRRKQARGGKELDVELMFDVDANLEADDKAKPGSGTLRRRSRRPSFPPG